MELKRIYGQKGRIHLYDLLALSVLATSFSLGMCYEAKSNRFERFLERHYYSRYEPEKGFAKDPWNLEVLIEVNDNGKLESYLYNRKEGVKKKINENYSAGTISDFVKPRVPSMSELKRSLEKRLNEVLPPKGDEISLDDKIKLYKDYFFARVHKIYSSIKNRFGGEK